MKISVRNLEPTKVEPPSPSTRRSSTRISTRLARKSQSRSTCLASVEGHVPGKIIDQRIGFGAVAGEAVNNGVPELYSKALETKKIHPMAQPEIDVQTCRIRQG